MSTTLLHREEKRLYRGELTKERIKDIFVARCYAKNLYVPLKNFLREIEVGFSSAVSTAGIGRFPEGLRLLVNKEFVEEHCENDSDVADLIMHEVFHHLLRHTDKGPNQDINPDAEHLALDSIINAHLTKIGSAGFCAKYYQDEVPVSFLRPDSKEFLLPQHDVPEPTLLQKLLRTQKRSRIPPPELLVKYELFYEQLYDLKVTQDEAIAFFQECFPETPPQRLLLGSHGSLGGGQADGSSDGHQADASPQEGEAGTPGEANGAGEKLPDGGASAQEKAIGTSDTIDSGFGHGPPSPHSSQGYEGHSEASAGRGRSVGSIFDLDEIRRILESLGLKQASKKAKNNFAQVIKQITTLSTKPGKIRKGTVYSKRLPSRLNRRDLLSIERGRYVFERGDYKSEEVVIFFDYSGSMSEYQRFLIDLAGSLRRIGLHVRVVIWADGVKEISYGQFLKGEIPDVGWGTQGEVVAQFICDEKVKQCVIVTDNMAGSISTKVSARVFLVLVKHGTLQGSFADRSVIPDRKIFWLEP